MRRKEKSFSITIIILCFTALKATSKENVFFFYSILCFPQKIKPLQGCFVIPHLLLCHKLEFFTDNAQITFRSHLC